MPKGILLVSTIVCSWRSHYASHLQKRWCAVRRLRVLLLPCAARTGSTLTVRQRTKPTSISSLRFCPGLAEYNHTINQRNGKASPGAHGVYLTNGGFWKSAFQLAEIAKTADFDEKSGKNPFFAIPVSPKGSVQGAPKRPFLPLFDPLGTPWGPPGDPGKPGCPYRPLISYKIGGMPTKTPGGYFLDFSILMHLRLL